MNSFRNVIIPAFFTICLFALIAYASARQNRDFDVSNINDMNVNNHVFPSNSLPYATGSGH